jgi:hypothetical protein
MRSLTVSNRCSALVCLCLLLAPVSLAQADDVSAAEIAEGERLVHNHDCNVCHTPKVMTPQGPQPDPGRLLSGHRADETLPALPQGVVGPTGWGGLFNHSLTAWVGPWGGSFGSNLTPDPETGIGDMSLETFMDSMRTGMLAGETRPFLPPMPTYDRLTDSELRAIYAYLRSIPAIHNEVPSPLPPPAQP